MTKRQRKELNALVAEYVERTSKLVREKFEKKRVEMVSLCVGLRSDEMGSDQMI